MKAGKLKNRASIERRDPDDDGLDDFGNPTDAAWSQLVSARPCSIIPIIGREEDIADRPRSVVRYRCVFRYSAAMKSVGAGDSVVLSRDAADLVSGDRLNIEHNPIDPTGRRDRLEFTATFGDAAG